LKSCKIQFNWPNQNKECLLKLQVNSLNLGTFLDCLLEIVPPMIPSSLSSTPFLHLHSPHYPILPPSPPYARARMTTTPNKFDDKYTYHGPFMLAIWLCKSSAHSSANLSSQNFDKKFLKFLNIVYIITCNKHVINIM
jgi:hypothetical protein